MTLNIPEPAYRLGVAFVLGVVVGVASWLVPWPTASPAYLAAGSPQLDGKPPTSHQLFRSPPIAIQALDQEIQDLDHELTAALTRIEELESNQ